MLLFATRRVRRPAECSGEPRPPASMVRSARWVRLRPKPPSPPFPDRPCRCGRGTVCAPPTDVKGLTRDPQEIPNHFCVVHNVEAVLHRPTHRLSTGTAAFRTLPRRVEQ